MCTWISDSASVSHYRIARLRLITPSCDFLAYLLFILFVMMATSSSPGPPAIISGSPSDASSLRAAALRTLKSGKRRRPASGQIQETVLAGSASQDVLQLDYGQDDNTSDLPLVLPKAPALLTSAFHDVPPAPQLTEAMDVDMKEEGEISDEEPPQAEVTSPKLVPMQTDDTQNDRLSTPSVSSHLGSPAPALLARISISQSPASNSLSSSSAPLIERLSHSPSEIVQEPLPTACHSDTSSDGRNQPYPEYDSHPHDTHHSDEKDELDTERQEIYPGLIGMFTACLSKVC